MKNNEDRGNREKKDERNVILQFQSSKLDS